MQCHHQHQHGVPRCLSTSIPYALQYRYLTAAAGSISAVQGYYQPASAQHGRLRGSMRSLRPPRSPRWTCPRLRPRASPRTRGQVGRPPRRCSRRTRGLSAGSQEGGSHLQDPEARGVGARRPPVPQAGGAGRAEHQTRASDACGASITEIPSNSVPKYFKKPPK